VATEHQRYEPLRRDGNLELRRYAGSVHAAVRVQAHSHSEATSAGFEPLAGYIFGGNHEAASIDMTVPVTSEHATGRRIEMTVPVTAERDGDQDDYVVRFTMPGRFTSVAELPRPNDNRVTLEESSQATVAAIGFMGRLTEAAVQVAQRDLMKWIEGLGMNPAGAPVVAQYDGPWKPPFLRHNELLIPVVAGEHSNSDRPIERVRDYPRPPSITREALHIRAAVGNRVIADTRRPVVIRETYHPPVFYLPPENIDMHSLEPTDRRTFCEFKGEARYFTLVAGERRVPNAAWYYPSPAPGYEDMANHVAFYPWALDEATVDGVQVEPQPGHFYGGWITEWVEGPFKGGPGTAGW
jgi:uncharacterized protein (DUF427 family)